MNEITLKFKGNSLYCKLGLGFLGSALKNIEAEDVSDLFGQLQKNPFDILPKLVYECAKYGSLRKQEEFNYSLFDVVDFIDEDGGIQSKEVEKFLAAFTSSINRDVPQDKPNPAQKGKIAKKK